MKTLKVTLILALIFASFTSCTKQDLNEDDVLVDSTTQETVYTGGNVND